MKHKSTLKRGKHFRQHTRKKSAYGGVRASKPSSVSTLLNASAPEWKPPTRLSASALVWSPPPTPPSASTSLRASAPVWTPPSTEVTPEMYKNMVRIINNQIVAIDCEMVGVGSENALAHVAIIDLYGNEIYNKYVIPLYGINSITNYRTKYSGITKNILRNKNNNGKALPFETIKSEVHAILKDKLIVGHGLINDFKVLDYTPDDDSVWDTTLINGYMKNHPNNIGLPEGSKRRQAKKLKVLAKEIANNNIQMNHITGHSPLEDARASMNLYRISRGLPKIVYRDMAVA